MSVLRVAAQAADFHLVGSLIEESVFSPSEKDPSGRTDLSFATEEDHIEVVELLFNQTLNGTDGADNEGNTPLVYACQNSHQDVVTWLLGDDETGLTLNEDLFLINQKVKGPLSASVLAGDLEMLNLIPRYPVDVNAIDSENGYIPLYHVVHFDLFDTADRLSRF
ncbi:hypothetical protein ACHAQC_011953 [Fusarium culmorum]